MKRFLSLLGVIIMMQQCVGGLFHEVTDYSSKFKRAGSIHELVQNCNRYDIDELIATYVFIHDTFKEIGFDDKELENLLKDVRKDLLDGCTYLSVKVAFYRSLGINKLYSVERINDDKD